ncbi:MAG: hypothetical protein E7139_08610 [Rikenellaceae bacterium]|nr:hypothetical protein [Rikenellaceae bacterium]
MKRVSLYILLLTLFCAGCNPVEPVPNDSLSILSGVTNNTLTLDGEVGSQATFAISSKLAWEVLDTPGVEYSPANGEATTKTTITATATEANLTLQSRKLGDVVIRLSRTRFTGIEAHQKPQIVVEEQYRESIAIAPEQNSATEVTFECKNSDFEVISEGEITISQPKVVGTNKYRITISTTKDNLSSERHTAGYIGFKVGGERLTGKIAVIQQPAISFDRSRIIINGTAGATMTINVDTPFDFDATSSSTNLTVQRGEGQSVILTVKERNSSDSERKVAQMTVTLKDNPACKATIEVWQRKERADQALLFYFLGTSLKGYYQSNLAMVESLASKGVLDNSRVIVFLQNSTNSGSMFEIRYDSDSKRVVRDQIADYDLPAVYNEQMLYNIFNDLFATAPAAEYGLYVGSHGRGWIPKIESSTGLTTYQTAIEERIWTPAPGAAMVRHIGDTTATQLNTTEFAQAIARTGVHLNYIIFDVCYMANVETAYDLKGVTDYILGSPCEVMAAGMPYTDMIPTMVSNAPLKERLDSAAKAFVDYYKINKEGIYSSACSAVIACNELEALAQSVKLTNQSMKDIDPATIQVYDGISASRNPTHIFFDLEHYITQSCTDSNAVKAFTDQLSRTLSGQHHTTTFYSAYNNKANPITDYCGLTTSAPIMLNTASAYRDDWTTTAWYKATH